MSLTHTGKGLYGDNGAKSIADLILLEQKGPERLENQGQEGRGLNLYCIMVPPVFSVTGPRRGGLPFSPADAAYQLEKEKQHIKIAVKLSDESRIMLKGGGSID